MDFNTLLFRKKVRYASIVSPAPGGVFVRRLWPLVDVPGFMATGKDECGVICFSEFTGRTTANPVVRSAVAEYRYLVDGECIYRPSQNLPIPSNYGQGWMFGLGYPALSVPPIPGGRSLVRQVSGVTFPNVYVGPSSRVQVQVKLLWPWWNCILHCSITMAVFYLSDFEEAARKTFKLKSCKAKI